MYLCWTDVISMLIIFRFLSLTLCLPFFNESIQKSWKGLSWIFLCVHVCVTLQQPVSYLILYHWNKRGPKIKRKSKCLESWTLILVLLLYFIFIYVIISSFIKSDLLYLLLCLSSKAIYIYIYMCVCVCLSVCVCVFKNFIMAY